MKLIQCAVSKNVSTLKYFRFGSLKLLFNCKFYYWHFHKVTWWFLMKILSKGLWIHCFNEKPKYAFVGQRENQSFCPNKAKLCSINQIMMVCNLEIFRILNLLKAKKKCVQMWKDLSLVWELHFWHSTSCKMSLNSRNVQQKSM